MLLKPSARKTRDSPRNASPGDTLNRVNAVSRDAGYENVCDAIAGSPASDVHAIHKAFDFRNIQL